MGESPDGDRGFLCKLVATDGADIDEGRLTTRLPSADRLADADTAEASPSCPESGPGGTGRGVPLTQLFRTLDGLELLE